MKINKHIAIVRSSKPRLSSLSTKSCESLFKLLSLHYVNVSICIIDNIFDLQSLVNKNPDLVFMGMKYVLGLSGEDKVWISEYLNEHGIPHTGSSREAIELEQNKPLAKQRVLDAGLKTSAFATVKMGDSFQQKGSLLRFPLFVKPPDLGAGLGINEKSVVTNQSELNERILSLKTLYNSDALIESFLSGPEYSVAILKDHSSDKLLAMPLELKPAPNTRGHCVLSNKLKVAVLETPAVPVADPKVKNSLVELATGVFLALGACDYGRIDIRMDSSGVPHFLEANLIPCLIKGSGNFPKACLMNIGMDYDEMILHIVRLGFGRSERPIEYEPVPTLVLA